MKGGLEKEEKGDKEYLESHFKSPGKDKCQASGNGSGNEEWERERALDNSQTSSYGAWENGRAVQKHKEYSKSSHGDFILVHVEFVIST